MYRWPGVWSLVTVDWKQTQWRDSYRYIHAHSFAWLFLQIKSKTKGNRPLHGVFFFSTLDIGQVARIQPIEQCAISKIGKFYNHTLQNKEYILDF